MTEAYPWFVAAAEALTDMIVADDDKTRGTHWHSQVGGSTWNVARAMARPGIPTAFAGAVSRDVFGDQLWQASLDAGLDPRFLQRLDKSPLLAIVHRLDPPSHFFVGDDSADLHFDATRLPAGWEAQCRWAHFGGISLAREPLAGRLYTKGAQGASLHTPAGQWRVAAPRIAVVDTVGAGDASMAAPAWSMLHRPDADGASHLRFAVAGAAPRPAWRPERRRRRWGRPRGCSIRWTRPRR